MWCDILSPARHSAKDTSTFQLDVFLNVNAIYLLNDDDDER